MLSSPGQGERHPGPWSTLGAVAVTGRQVEHRRHDTDDPKNKDDVC